jgi:hypothetical protein
MRWAVSSLIGTAVGDDDALSTRDTVLCETSANRATSRMVTFVRVFRPFFMAGANLCNRMQATEFKHTVAGSQFGIGNC